VQKEEVTLVTGQNLLDLVALRNAIHAGIHGLPDNIEETIRRPIFKEALGMKRRRNPADKECGAFFQQEGNSASDMLAFQ
jgi:hypothetical protein